MASLLKQRLIGAIVLISLGIIFIPMLLTGRGNLFTEEPESNVPPKPMYEIQAPGVVPLEKRSAAEPTMQPVIDDQASASTAQELGKSPEASVAAKTADNGSAEDKTESGSESADTGSEAMKSETAKAEKSDTASKTESAPQKAVSTETKTSVATKSAAPKSSKPIAEKPAAVPTKSDKPATTAKLETSSANKPAVSGWVVQLGSFSVEKNALKLRDQLRKNGHASFVEAYKHDGKTSYRVRVGPELTRELAEQLKIRLKKETKLSGLIISFPQ